MGTIVFSHHIQMVAWCSTICLIIFISSDDVPCHWTCQHQSSYNGYDVPSWTLALKYSVTIWAMWCRLYTSCTVDYVLLCVTTVVFVPGCANVCQCVQSGIFLCSVLPNSLHNAFIAFIALLTWVHGKVCFLIFLYFDQVVSGSNKGCSQLARVDPATWLQVPGNPLVQPLLILPSSSPSSSSSSSSSPSSEHLV